MGTARQLTMDSSSMTTLALLHKELTASLAETGKLNITQYRVLLKSYELADRASISEIAAALNLRPNVVSIAADKLESEGLAKRADQPGDKRVTVLAVTPTGKRRVKAIDVALNRHFDALWSTSSLSEEDMEQVRDTLQAMGSGIEGMPDTSGLTAVSSSYLAAIAEAYRGVADTLEEAAHVSFSDCRVLQWVEEAGGRARIIDIAAALVLPPTTVTRAADRLQARGWVNRVTEPGNLQAVFLETAAEGRRWLTLMQAALDHYAEWRLWRQLTEEQRAVSPKATRMVAKSLGSRHSPEILKRKSG